MLAPLLLLLLLAAATGNDKPNHPTQDATHTAQTNTCATPQNKANAVIMGQIRGCMAGRVGEKHKLRDAAMQLC